MYQTQHFTFIIAIFSTFAFHIHHIFEFIYLFTSFTAFVKSLDVSVSINHLYIGASDNIVQLYASFKFVINSTFLSSSNNSFNVPLNNTGFVISKLNHHVHGVLYECGMFL